MPLKPSCAVTVSTNDAETESAAITSSSSKKPKRFHGTVSLDPARVGRDASQIADEVIAHLTGLVRADVKAVLEIEAAITPGTYVWSWGTGPNQRTERAGGAVGGVK